MRVSLQGDTVGYRYYFDFDTEPATAADRVYRHRGIEFRVAKQYLEFLRGTEIDYVKSNAGLGFQFNRNAHDDRAAPVTLTERAFQAIRGSLASNDSKKQNHIYDDATWHENAQHPHGAFVRTGFFVGWLIERKLLSVSWSTEMASDVASFLARKKTGPQIYDHGDGKLVADMLSEKANQFARDYYDGLFWEDYKEVLSGKLADEYGVEDTWENYEILRKRIDQRFAESESRKSR